MIALSRAVKPAAITVAVLAALGAVTYVSGPLFVKDLVEEKLGEALLGRKVNIGELTLNLYTLTVQADNVRISEVDGSTPFAKFDHLLVNLGIASLGGGVRIQALDLAGPDVHLIRIANNRYNISDLVEKYSKPSDSPTLFALANLRVTSGRIVFEDRPLTKTQTVDRLTLSLPYLSNFPADLDVDTKPDFSARLNGKPVSLLGDSKVFKSSHDSSLTVKLDGVDLMPLLPYLPVALPVHVNSLKLDTDLKVDFKDANNAPQLTLSGVIGLRDLALSDRQGAALGELERASIHISHLKPFAHDIAIKEVSVTAPKLALTRTRDGQLNWLRALAPAGPAPVAPAADSKATPWRWSLDNARIRRGEVLYRDEAPAGGYRTRVNDLSFDLARLNSTSATPASVRLHVSTDRDEKLAIDGRLTLQQMASDGTFTLENLDAGALRDYVAPVLKPYTRLRLDNLHANADGAFTFALENGTPRYSLRNGNVGLADLKLSESARDPAIEFKQLAVSDIALDSSSKRVEIGQAVLKSPVVHLLRDRRGDNVERWFIAQKPGPAVRGSQSWRVLTSQASVEDGSLLLKSTQQRRNVVVNLTRLNVRTRNVDSGRLAQLPIEADAVVNQRGKLALKGSIDVARQSGTLNVDARSIDLSPLTVLPTRDIRVNVKRVDLNARGQLRFANAPAGLEAGYRGTLALNNVLALDEINRGLELARWHTLALDGIDFAYGPKVQRLHVGTINANDFFVRAVLSQDGRLNFREIQGDFTGPTQPTGIALVKAPEKADTRTTLSGTSTTTVEGQRPAPSAPSGPPMDISVNRIVLNRGWINWTDNLIQPNMRADLTQLSGSIGRIATRDNAAGAIDIKGRVNRDAPLTLSGKVNPFARPLLLDLSASVKSMDLPALTPYSRKYAGYPIEKGKLSLDLHYRIADNQLKADNRLFLDQLTFGDKVDSPDATSLPVLLAVKLLKNRKGEIDVNLPVSGTLDDPDFSIGGVIFRVVVNLLEKAVTAPFDLLAHAFGGDVAQLSHLDMVGTGLTADNRKQLDTLAGMLADKPDLNLEIRGVADVDGARRAHLEQEIKRRWRNDEAADDDAEPGAAQRNKLLKAVYDDGSFKKPRNLIGFAKTLPPAEMEQLIMANTKVSERDVQQVAGRRAQEVKRYLEEQAKVDPSRLFLLAGKQGDKNGVDFSLK